jgi:hypothetical protein
MAGRQALLQFWVRVMVCELQMFSAVALKVHFKLTLNSRYFSLTGDDKPQLN